MFSVAGPHPTPRLPPRVSYCVADPRLYCGRRALLGYPPPVSSPPPPLYLTSAGRSFGRPARHGTGGKASQPTQGFRLAICGRGLPPESGAANRRIVRLGRSHWARSRCGVSGRERVDSREENRCRQRPSALGLSDVGGGLCVVVCSHWARSRGG